MSSSANGPSGATDRAETPREEGLPPFVSAILDSRTFERAPTLRALLSYLWLWRTAPISEYAVATEALGRNALFDPKIDATVRVQISRLRQRLEKYYEAEGKSAGERLTIPLGCHLVEVTPVQPSGGAADKTDDTVARALPAQSWSRTVWMLSAVCAVLTVASVTLAVQLSRATAAQANRPAVGAHRFWSGFFANSRPTRIILPTPIFFSWPTRGRGPGGSVMFRDTEINEFTPQSDSEVLRNLRQKYGNPSLAQSYTVTSDTFAAVRLGRFLDLAGFNTQVMSSASAPLEALDRENIIALGTWGTLAPLRPYLDQMSFELARHEGYVTNRAPGLGEPRVISTYSESSLRQVVPGVIAVLPGHVNQTHLLILASRHTSALVSFLTSSVGMGQLDLLWRAKGSPEYYEVVVNAEMNGDDLVRFWPALLHSYPMTLPASATIAVSHP